VWWLQDEQGRGRVRDRGETNRFLYLYPFIALSDTESGPDWGEGKGGLAKPSPSLPIFVSTLAKVRVSVSQSND
jgi:hypothetical protein